ARRPARAALVDGDLYSLLAPLALLSESERDALPASGQWLLVRHLLSADIHLCGSCPSFSLRGLRDRRLSTGFRRFDESGGAARCMANGAPFLALALLGERAHHAPDDALHLYGDPEPA